MVSIPRYLSGFQIALIGVVFMAWCGAEGGLVDRTFVGAALVAVFAFIVIARPHFVLTPQGLRFALKIFGLLPITYARIERARIRSVTVAWDKDGEVDEFGNAYRTTYLGILLEYTGADTGRTRRFTLRRGGNREEALRRGAEYAAALACPLKTR